MKEAQILLSISEKKFQKKKQELMRETEFGHNCDNSIDSSMFFSRYLNILNSVRSTNQIQKLEKETEKKTSNVSRSLFPSSLLFVFNFLVI